MNNRNKTGISIELSTGGNVTINLIDSTITKKLQRSQAFSEDYLENNITTFVL